VKLFSKERGVAPRAVLSVRDTFRNMCESINAIHPLDESLYDDEMQAMSDVVRRAFYSHLNSICVTTALYTRSYASRDVSRYICSMVRADARATLQSFLWRLFADHGDLARFSKVRAMCWKAVQRGYE
jgi:hypothetical protein